MQAFLAALRARDLATAREFVAVYRHAAFDAAMQDAQFFDQAVQHAHNIRDLRLLRIQRNTSVVEGVLDRDGQPRRAEFILERDTATRHWKLDVF